MHLATDNITFTVLSGPGFVQGTGNGDPHSQEPNNAPWHTAYHGLVRAVVRVNSMAGRSTTERALLALIDVHGPMSSSSSSSSLAEEEHSVYDSGGDSPPIVVQASSPGFAPVTVSIPTSTDANTAGVYAVAEAGAGQPVDFFNP